MAARLKSSRRGDKLEGGAALGRGRGGGRIGLPFGPANFPSTHGRGFLKWVGGGADQG